MKILHLADLHLGKRVNEMSMIEDQKYILDQIITLIKEESVGIVLLCGDIYDKSIPTIEAIHLLDEFLDQLSKMAIKVLMISGNHDSIDRLSNILSGVVINALIYGALALASRKLLGLIPGAVGNVLSQIPVLDVGIPAVLSVYFDWFSGVMQAFIFCMLTVMYIANASEE